MFFFCFLSFLIAKRFDPGSGNLITFLQFAFIALEGFMFTANFGREKLRIGFRDYFILVAMFFASSVCNNYAFDFNIPMPLHMIFRSVKKQTNKNQQNEIFFNFFFFFFVFYFEWFHYTKLTKIGFAYRQYDNGYFNIEKKIYHF